MDHALRALNRFGLGARIGERRALPDPRTWLLGQLEGDPPSLDGADLPAADEIAEALRGLRTAAQGDEARRMELRRRLMELARREGRAALTARVTSDRPFVERLVAFWSNHLCVSASAKLLVAPLAGAYEREAIRPRVLGRFDDLVLASARHPAMLSYLDNFQSIGPRSRAARLTARRGVERGLNENYARELLELHTLGVDGGYTQDDVVELARILTGWTVQGLGGPADAAARAMGPGAQPGGGGRPRPGGRPGRGRPGGLPGRPGRPGGLRGGAATPPPDGPARFFFAEALHEPGTKTLLGERYREAGEEEGRRAITALCRHPSTARFVAGKLVRHFVSDEPPAAAVDAVARVFRETEGDLRAVSAALVERPEAWDPANRKFRTPQEWLVAGLRALAVPETPDAVAPLLRQLRHPLWAPPSPAGFTDLMRDWADPDALLNRAELARTLGRRMGGSAGDPRALLDVVEAEGAGPLPDLLADTGVPAAERLALALASPAFQWR